MGVVSVRMCEGVCVSAHVGGAVNECVRASVQVPVHMHVCANTHVGTGVRACVSAAKGSLMESFFGERGLS